MPVSYEPRNFTNIFIVYFIDKSTNLKIRGSNPSHNQKLPNNSDDKVSLQVFIIFNALEILFYPLSL